MSKQTKINKSDTNKINLTTWQSKIDLIKNAKNLDEIIPPLRAHINHLIATSEINGKYEVLFLYDPTRDIREWTADQIYSALTKNDSHNKDLLLIIHNNGGSIEAAYFISKACNELSKSFKVSVPRKAKSAATPLCLGAEEIHMGLMSQLGPIDPQVGNLPALGVGDAIRKMAMLCELYPKSAEMFARYLYFSIQPAVLGYMDRMPASAAQYAERLLEDKKLPAQSDDVPVWTKLVYEYKSHGFVIDKTEAQKLLGNCIKTDTPELKLSEDIYKFLEEIRLMTKIFNNNSLSLIGDLDNGFNFFEIKNEF